MKKTIILICAIAVLVLLAVVVLNMPLFQYSYFTVPEPLYKYFTDSKLRSQYKEFRICQPYKTKESCLKRSSCEWVASYGLEGYKREYCVYESNLGS